GRLDRAAPLYEEALRLFKARQGSSHPDTLNCMNNLAAAYRASGDAERSLALLREAAAPLEKIGFEAQYADRIVHNLIGTMELLGRLDEAESWRRKWLAAAKERSGADSIPYADESQALGIHLLRRERWSDAEAVLRESLAVRDVREPDAPETHRNRSLLGRALMGRKAYAEAEPVLVQAY
ncbi:tetratricopeptide repeat protein, partial [Paludisphaera soli]|uniref:tetratricopeptide repeat protein n=1 Tax=Paludisphaera soli TaxID=2712865 RepID=UPI0013ECB0C0